MYFYRTKKYPLPPQIKTIMTMLTVGKDAKKPDHSYMAGGNAQWNSDSGQQFGHFLEHLTCNYHTTSSYTCRYFYPRDMKTYVHTNTCTQMFTAATFIIATNWKQPTCPSTSEWWSTLWYNHAVGYCSAMNTNPWYTRLRWICRELCYVNKANPKGLHMSDSMYVAPLKWQSYRNGE